MNGRRHSEDGEDDFENRKRRRIDQDEESDDEEMMRKYEQYIGEDDGEQNDNEYSHPLVSRFSGPISGIIKEISIENFMCHQKLDVKLCPNINFINGQNGSGKSAILAAIQICLGAKASITHRARGLKDLIRSGGNWDAYLTISLVNTPADGWRYDEYGDTIKIERKISRTGQGHFKLYGQDNKVKSTEKKHLIEMLDHLNIQVENPCAVLDQENSKKFLQGNNKDKYKFFMRSTNLDNLIQKIEETSINRKKMYRAAEKQRLKLEPLKEIVDQAKRELDQFDQLDKLAHNIVRSKAALAWVHVEQKEMEAAEQEKLFKKLELKCSKETERQKELKEKYEKEEERLLQLEEESGELRQQCDAVTETLESLKQELEQKERPKREKQLEARQLKTELKETESLRKTALNHIKEARAQAAASEDMKEEEQNMEHQIQFCLEDLQRLNGQEERITALQQDVEVELSNCRTDFMDARQDAQEKSNEVDREEAILKGMEKSRNSPLNKFSRWIPMESIVSEINRRRSTFQSVPVGPIGMHVAINPQYKGAEAAAEACVEKVLDNFVVTNAVDKSLLLKIFMQKIGTGPGKRYPTIIIQSGRHGRYRIKEMPPGILTVAQALKIEDDLVFNVLVDQCKIDVSAIFDSKEAGEQAVLRGTLGHQYLDYGIRECIITGGGRGEKADIFYVRGGNTTYRTNFGPQNRVLGVDMQDQIRRRKAAIQAMKKDDKEMRQRMKRKEELMVEKEQQMNDLEREKNGLRQKRKKQEHTMRRLNADLVELRAQNEEVDTSTWEAEVEEYAIKERSIQNEIAQVNETLKEMEVELEPLKLKKVQEQQKANDLNDEMARKEEEFLQSSENMEMVKERKERVEAKLEEIEFSRQQGQDSVQAKKVEVEVQIQKAETICEGLLKEEWDGNRIDTKGFDAKRLEAYIVKRTAKLDKARREKQLTRKSKEECKTQHLRALSSYKERESSIKQVISNAERIERENKERVVKYKRFRKFIERQTNAQFDEHLQKRGSSGQVAFQGKLGTLEIIVQKDNMDDSTQTNDIKALSGGERSAATLALLLALGASIECPFRIMDEFDIFMDAVSRKTALLQVIDHGRSDFMRGRQIILITPQNLDAVETGEDIKIFRLQPPERRTA